MARDPGLNSEFSHIVGAMLGHAYSQEAASSGFADSKSGSGAVPATIAVGILLRAIVHVCTIEHPPYNAQLEDPFLNRVRPLFVVFR